MCVVCVYACVCVCVCGVCVCLSVCVCACVCGCLCVCGVFALFTWRAGALLRTVAAVLGSRRYRADGS